MGALNMWISFQ